MIYLIRHGQTQFNAAGRWQGQVDSPLTELGISQAKAVANTLAELTAGATTVIFASPLGRAHDTAKIIAGKISQPDAIILDQRLMEIGMGAWDGLTDYEIEQEWPNARDGIERHEWFFNAPQGETFEVLSNRAGSAFTEVKAHDAQIKIIVSHGITGRVLRGIHGKLPREQALQLDVPQDAIFRLTDHGMIERIPVM